MKSLRRIGRPLAARASRRSSREPPKCWRSVSIDSAAAPPRSYACTTSVTVEPSRSKPAGLRPPLTARTSCELLRERHEALERPCRLASVDRGLGSPHALLQRGGAAGDVDRRARVEQSEVAFGAGLAGED